MSDGNGTEPFDPYAVLGVAPTISDGELARARRRAAWGAHPDRGGSAEAMTRINQAFTDIMSQRSAMLVRPEGANRAPSGHRRHETVHRDAPSFTIDVLPVEAFEYVLLAAQELGEVIDSEPPYVLEVLMRHAGDALDAVPDVDQRSTHDFDQRMKWCRLEIVPDAGSSTVSLWCEGGRDDDADLEHCRDLWVSTINALAGPPLG